MTIPYHLILLLLLFVAGCSNGDTSSSGGPTEFAGTYLGTVTANGIESQLKVTITMEGFVRMEVVGGVVCAGDLPTSIGLDGNKFSSTTTEQCIIGGLPCPVNTSVSGSVSGSSLSGSGQVHLGCPNGPVQPIAFSFRAAER